MAVELMTSIDNYVGASGDNKPVTPPVGSIFYESDTGKHYIYAGGAWTQYANNIYTANIYPIADNTYALGSANLSWNDLHVQNLIYATSVVGNWLPSADDTYDLGENSTPLEWKDLYLDGIAYIDELRAGDSAAIYVRGLTVASIPTLYGVGAYLRIGDAAATSHALASEDDLMVTGKLEVGGVSFFDAILTIADTRAINTGVVNDDYFTMGAVDNDTNTITEILRFVGAAAPHLTVGAPTAYKVKLDPAVAGIQFGDSSNSWDLMLSLGDSDTVKVSNPAGTYRDMAFRQAKVNITGDQQGFFGSASYDVSFLSNASLTDATPRELVFYGLNATGNAWVECLRMGSASDLAAVGFFGASIVNQQAHIVDADGTLADITTKFNTLLADLEGYGFLAAS